MTHNNVNQQKLLDQWLGTLPTEKTENLPPVNPQDIEKEETKEDTTKSQKQVSIGCKSQEVCFNSFTLVDGGFNMFA
jgi:hypothetical protein